MADKLKIAKPIICEGKYDKIKLSSLLDAKIITTDGFGIFKEEEKLSLIRRLAEKSGIIVFTDPDGAGLVIRNYFNSVLPKEQVTHLYIPAVKGKEKRKKAPSKEGLLGVEGMEAERLRAIFAPFAADALVPESSSRPAVTKAAMFADGLSGGNGSEEKRKALATRLSLPTNMSANALMDAINLLCTEEEYRAALAEIGKENA